MPSHLNFESTDVVKFQFEHRVPEPAFGDVGPDRLALHDVRVIPHGDSFLVVAADLAKVLGHRDAATMTAYLEPGETSTVKGRTGSQRGGGHTLTLVTEAGVYRLLARSNKPEAKAFQRWLYHEVLPSIRRTGGYSKPKAAAAKRATSATPKLARPTGALIRETRLLLDSFGGLSSEGRQCLAAHVLNGATGLPLLPPPVIERSAVQMSEIARRIGVFDPKVVNRMGRVATAAGLRTPEHCRVVLTTAPSGKQVEQTVWFEDTGVPAVLAVWRVATAALEQVDPSTGAAH